MCETTRLALQGGEHVDSATSFYEFGHCIGTRLSLPHFLAITRQTLFAPETSLTANRNAGVFQRDWLSVFERGDLHLDPMVQAVLTSPGEVVWSYDPGAAHDPRRAAALALADRHGIRSGLFVPLFSAEGLDAVLAWFGPGIEPPTESTRFLARLAALQLFERMRALGWLSGSLPLAPREKECLVLTGDGLTCAQIADRLQIATRTVEAYLASAMMKLGAANKAQAIALAMRRGLLR